MRAPSPHLLLWGLLLAGCSADSSELTKAYELVDNRLWERVTGGADPWDGSRPVEVDACGDAELTVEDLGDEIWFDLNTRSCA